MYVMVLSSDVFSNTDTKSIIDMLCYTSSRDIFLCWYAHYIEVTKVRNKYLLLLLFLTLFLTLFLIYFWYIFDIFLIYFWYMFDIFLIYFWYIFDIFLIYFWYIFDIFLIYFWYIFDIFLIYFWYIFDIFLIYFWYIFDIFLIYFWYILWDVIIQISIAIHNHWLLLSYDLQLCVVITWNSNLVIKDVNYM